MFEEKRKSLQRQQALTPEPVQPQASSVLVQRARSPLAAWPAAFAKMPAMQRQIAAPALKASAFYTQEVGRVSAQATAVQRQLAELPALPAGAVEAALQRQQAELSLNPPILKPQSRADWVTVMRQQAEQAEGRRMGAKESAQFTALQRQVANTLVQGFRQDRQPAFQRYAEYADHLVSLQRHPSSSQVAHAVMTMIPQGERPALQRAVDERLEQEALQRQQDEQALQLQSLQRQLAEVNAEAATPVFERIEARRGAGNPLPEAIQRHLEQGLNHDLSGVRIHDDAEADKLAKGVNAIAFTAGRDIFFQAGKFSPNTQSGLELLAHEVTHTVQQSKGQVGQGIDPDAGLESEARAMGRTLANKKFNAGPLKAKSLPKLNALNTRAAVQRLQAKPQMTWNELQGILKAKLLSRLSQNATQLKTETTKYQKTGATPEWQHLLQLLKADQQVQTQQRSLIKGVQQKFPQGLAGLPFPAKLGAQAATPDPTYWLSYIQTVSKQLGSHSGPYVEAMRQLAASEGLRAAAHKTFPAMSALATTGTSLEAGKTPQLLGEMKGQFAKTTDAIGQLRNEIQAGKIPWKYADLVVQDIFRDYGVKADAPAMQAYQQALKSEQMSQAVAMLLTVGVSVAALVASGPAALALGVVAAASGAGQAYLQTQDVRKQLEVSEAGRFGQNLTSVQLDVAKFQIAIGYLNTALSVIDLVAVGKVVALASGSVLVGRGLESVEKVLAGERAMTPQPIPIGAESSGGRIATSAEQGGLETNMMSATRLRVGGAPVDPLAEEAIKQFGKLPSNWVDVKALIGKPFEPSKLPGPYTLAGKGRNVKINLPVGQKGLAPLMVDEEGRLQLRTQQRLSIASLMRKNYVAVYGAIPEGHWLHHIIPDNLIRNHPLGQILQKIGYNLDDAENLLAMPDQETFKEMVKNNPKLVGHWSSHDNYDRLVRNQLTLIYERWQKKGLDLNHLDATHIKELRQEILELENALRRRIKSGDVPVDPDTGRLSMHQEESGIA